MVAPRTEAKAKAAAAAEKGGRESCATLSVCLSVCLSAYVCVCESVKPVYSRDLIVGRIRRPVRPSLIYAFSCFASLVLFDRVASERAIPRIRIPRRVLFSATISIHSNHSIVVAALVVVAVAVVASFRRRISRVAKPSKPSQE